MMDSQLFTFTPPFVSPSDSPSNVAAPIAMAWDAPVRVLVRNISLGITVFLAYNAEALQTVPAGSGVFRLPAGASEVFVLAPGQRLFTNAPSSTAKISVAISEALPVDAHV